MTKNKLRKAVSSVLSAWTNWSVYNSNFIDELESKFEGREITVSVKPCEEDEEVEQTTENGDEADEGEMQDTSGDKDVSAVSTTPRGTWTSATSVDVDMDIDGEAIDDDIDGEAIDDGEVLDDNELDGEELDDGEELLEDDIDGAALDEDDG